MSEETKNTEHIAENAEVEADTIFGTAPAAAPVKTGGMSGNVRGLLIGLCALVLAGAALTAVMLLTRNLLDDSAENSTETVETSTISLNEADVTNLEGIDIRHAEPFHVTRTFRGREDAPAEYCIDGYEDLSLDTALLSTLVNNGCALEADSLVEEQAEDLGKYGLADPLADVTLQYEDGTSFRFLVGSQSPMDTAKTYCAVDGNVYLVRTSLVSNYQKMPKQFLSTTILAKPADAESPIVESLRVERQDLDWDIYMEYDYESADDDSVGGTAATHVMREPIFSYLNVERSSNVTNGMFGLSAQEVALVHPTERDFGKTGLDDPFCTVTMKTDDGQTHVLTIGDSYETADGITCRYAYLEGVSEIFGVTEEAAAWITVQPGDITSSNIFVTNVWNIGTLEVEDKTHALHFAGEGTRDDYTVTKNGEPCETERFRTLYRFLLYIYGEELYLGEMPEGEPDAQVHLTTQDGREDYTISFYKVSDLKTIVARDGVPSYVIRTSCLDTLSYNLEIFDDTTTEFKTTWQ